jgi:hypothetical protein
MSTAAVEQGGVQEVFATLWASEYRSKLLITEDGSLPPPRDAPFRLEDVLQSLQVVVEREAQGHCLLVLTCFLLLSN